MILSCSFRDGKNVLYVFDLANWAAISHTWKNEEVATKKNGV